MTAPKHCNSSSVYGTGTCSLCILNDVCVFSIPERGGGGGGAIHVLYNRLFKKGLV